jgi:hypothetical protein
MSIEEQTELVIGDLNELDEQVEEPMVIPDKESMQTYARPKEN